MREKRSTANSIPSGDDEEVVEVALARLGAGVTYRTASLSAVLCFGYFAARYFVDGVSGHVADFLLVLLGVAIAGGLVPRLGSRIVSRALGLLDLGSCLAASGRRRFACAIAGPTIGLAVAGAIGFISLTTGSVLGGAVSVGCILIQIAAVIPMNLGILGPGPRGPGLPLFRLGIFGRDPRAECLPSMIIATSATVMAVGLIAQAIRFESAGFLAPGSIATAAMAIIGSVVAWVSGVGAIRLFRNGSKVRELRENTFRWQAPDPGLSVDLGLILAAIESIRRPRSPADRAAALVDAFGRIVARPIGWKERIAFSIAHAVMIMAAVAMVAAAVVGWKARFVGPWFIERSPDGRRVVMVERGGATIWDTVRGEEAAVLFRSGDPVLDAAFSPDGTRVVIASQSGGSIWDAEAGTRLVTLQGDPAAEGREYHVLAVAFSPDGNRIVGRIDLFTVRVWDAGSGAIVEGPVDPDLATLP